MLLSRIKILLIVIITCLFIACAPSERALKIAKLSGDAAEGRVYYENKCSRCHGTDGMGGQGLNLIEHRDGHDDAELIDTILEGSGTMPSFNHLEDQVIADIISHIRAL